MPAYRPKPTAPEAMIALVVGEDTPQDEADASALPVHTQRDHRVRVRFHWQPATSAAAASPPEDAEDGDGDVMIRAGRRDSGTPSVWLRVATAVAGPNWGAHTLPRVGTEVLVSFIDGDIDRPIVSHQLFNRRDLPPWSAGADSDANHPGTLSGWHSRNLDGKGFNQWLTDDAPGQVRTRFASSSAASQLNLGYLNTQAPDAAMRGNWRGTGAELRSDAWVVARAGEGMLISSSAQAGGQGPMQDAAGARGQLAAARTTAERISTAIEQAQGVPFAANEVLRPLADDLDPAAKGKYDGTVNGQAATLPADGGRDGRTPCPPSPAPW